MWKHGSVTSAEAISSLLSKEKIPQLKAIAVQTGNLISGNKQQLIQRLVEHFEGGPQKEPSSILSFDLGYRNLAYCHMNKEGEILDWARVDLMLPSFHPSVVAPIVRKFVRDRIENNLENVDQVVVELQRARSGGGIGIFEHTLRVNCVESLLWSGLYESVDRMQRPEIQMSAINPTAVDKLWKPEFEQLPIDNPELFKNMKSEKRRFK
ncbi:hypothetical protein BD770DRAFT_415289 [Pilaira anomala]|nr:hypothetical protein BD770DRAFT_415289 [Pilaira anomala]